MPGQLYCFSVCPISDTAPRILLSNCQRLSNWLRIWLLGFSWKVTAEKGTIFTFRFRAVEIPPLSDFCIEFQDLAFASDLLLL